MPHHAGHKALFRPAPVAVHNHGDMARDIRVGQYGLRAAFHAHGSCGLNRHQVFFFIGQKLVGFSHVFICELLNLLFAAAGIVF